MYTHTHREGSCGPPTLLLLLRFVWLLCSVSLTIINIYIISDAIYCSCSPATSLTKFMFMLSSPIVKTSLTPTTLSLSLSTGNLIPGVLDVTGRHLTSLDIVCGYNLWTGAFLWQKSIKCVLNFGRITNVFGFDIQLMDSEYYFNKSTSHIANRSAAHVQYFCKWNFHHKHNFLDRACIPSPSHHPHLFLKAAPPPP